MSARLAFALALVLPLAAAAQQPAELPCPQQAWHLAAAGRFRTAANAMALCAGPGALYPNDGLLQLADLAGAAAALQQNDWSAAAAAMQKLAADSPAPLPAALDPTLAPAFLRFGQGGAAAAAAMARAPARQATPLAPPFQAFLHHQYALRLWRHASLPALALYLVILIASFIFGLRRQLAPASAATPDAAA